MRKSQKNKGITLIALIITVIVLLILAGVSISLVVGDNGVLTQSKRASDVTQEKTAVEEVELAYSSLMSKYYEEYASNASVDKWAYVTTASLQAELNGTGTIIGEIEKNETTKEIEFTYDSGKNKTYKMKITYDGRVERVTGLSIPSTLALQKEENVAGTPTTITAVLDGITGQVNWTNSNSAVATISSTTGEQINVTPVSAGTTIIKAECDGIEKQCEVTVLSRVAVTFKLNGGSVNNSIEDVVRNEFPGTEITLPVPTKTGYIFGGWYSNQELTGNPLDGSTINTPSSEVTYWAKWREPSQAFRNYGNPVATDSASGTYGTIGTRVFLVTGSTAENPATITVGSGTIQDNWKVFYEDDNFVYLIYGDYYPVDVQTNPENPAITFGGNKAYAVTAGNRANLLKYLRNYSNYTWSSSDNNFATGGSTYTSWDNLQTALGGTTVLSGKEISIQGSPDIELWVKSWNAKGNTELKATKESNGYNIMGANESSNSNHSINVNTSPYNTTANETNKTGYYDELYFPYRADNSNGYGYWLASPSSSYSDYVRLVYCSGSVSYNHYLTTYCCARPVVSIAKQ